MNKQQFIQRFNYQRLTKINDAYHHHGQLRQASVLIALVEHNNGLEVVLTKRAAHLKHHPGQISFPGGKVEQSDSSLLAAALREAHEEIGLQPGDVQIVGQLKPHHVITGYQITPFIGFINPEYPFIIDTNEVAEIFVVPFEHFINEGNHLSFTVERRGTRHNIHFMPYMHYNIWGATAAIIKDLVQHLK
ncbi:CoA pyrophosphatase [Thalassotalea ponticola]|uniref:CoA pyrophosphatase n=1 Tax=Thalassotalea ponticola TaxID=1523392 RepID=UPI0025B37797|nr:CoA pyrophosphatase [Thalassotalea ponticola]MDN3651286.1 CoA pyrophosphatase [Thalassotalea ponticola]